MEQGLAAMRYGNGEGNTVRHAYGGAMTTPKPKKEYIKTKEKGNKSGK